MNKVILITGAAKRIGKEMAKEFFAIDCNVIVHFNSSNDDAISLCDELNAIRPNSAVSIQANLDYVEDVKNLASQAMSVFGRIDGLINNASTFYPTPMGDFSEKDWDALISSNLKAPLFLVQELHNELKKQSGFVINITDINIKRPIKNHSIYLAAKSGLDSLTKSLAKDLAPEIRVNAIAPGAILEPPNKTWTDTEKNNILNAVPLKKMGSEIDVAKAAIFLAESQYITGQTLNIDGGKSL